MKRRRTFSRRAIVKTASQVLCLSPLLGVSGCSDSNAVSESYPDGGAGAEADDKATGWLAGGTAAMKVPFPPVSDPMTYGGTGETCAISGISRRTLGPCYFDVHDMRGDISEGQPGVPMALALKFVDSDCDPIEGAFVEVWWCDRRGIYSGDDSASSGNTAFFSARFCTGNSADGLAARWFRGVQRTNGDGNVFYLGCFPGWYPGRTTHIHFRVVVDGVESLVSQLCFDDELSNDIYRRHPDYTGREMDTSNKRDFVFRSNWRDYLINVQRQPDGSMLAHKAIRLA